MHSINKKICRIICVLSNQKERVLKFNAKFESSETASKNISLPLLYLGILLYPFYFKFTHNIYIDSKSRLLFISPHSYKPGALNTDLLKKKVKYSLSVRDVIKAYRVIWIARNKLSELRLKHHKLSYFYIHFYEIYFVQEIISQFSPAEIIMSNHYDRWAFAVFESELDFTVSIIQHGIEDTTSVLPINKVDKKIKLYCYDMSQLNFFSNIFNNIIGVCFFRPLLELTPVSANATFLIIGHGVKSNYETEKLIALYLQSLNVNVYYKPHPIFKTDHQALKNVVTITNRYFFPDVDVIIHFGSTLAVEYQNTKPSVITYLFELETPVEVIYSELRALYEA